MRSQQRFSDVTRSYLCCFYEILKNMIDDMDGAQLTDSISYNFIVQMIPHHRAAIEMSYNILQYTTCIPLQEIALGIIEEQTMSIQNMLSILDRCAGLGNAQQDVCCYHKSYQQITQIMFTHMQDACSTNNINADFIREMIPHHKGAISMSQNALRFDICPELVPILQAIIKSQQKGVCEMERLLRCV